MIPVHVGFRGEVVRSTDIFLIVTSSRRISVRVPLPANAQSIFHDKSLCFYDNLLRTVNLEQFPTVEVQRQRVGIGRSVDN